MNPKFEVIVGNVGTVHSGNSYMKAQCTYSEYVKQSKRPTGRACGESVTLMHNGEIRSEYIGTIDQKEQA